MGTGSTQEVEASTGVQTQTWVEGKLVSNFDVHFGMDAYIGYLQDVEINI